MAAKAVFVDTDVFMRFLVRDSEGQYSRARELFELAESGDIKLETTVLVIAALADELSALGIAPTEIRDILRAVLSTRNLRVQSREQIAEAVEALGGGMGFRDAYAAAHMRKKGLTKIATFKRAKGTPRPEAYWPDSKMKDSA